jgi:hypothetical protein
VRHQGKALRAFRWIRPVEGGGYILPVAVEAVEDELLGHNPIGFDVWVHKFKGLRLNTRGREQN